MLKVYFAVNESGVNYWRGKIPYYELERRGLCEIRKFNVYDYSGEQASADIAWADVIYMPCATGIETLIEMTNYIKAKKAVVVDYDDNLFDCHPFNPAYATLGLYPITLNNPDGTVIDLWKDQRHGFSLNDNRKRFYAHVDILTVANQVTTTTNSLKRSLMENVTRDGSYFNVIPNAIDFKTFKPFDKRIRPKNVFRIGWAASDSHVVEARFVTRVIKELENRRSDFQFVILGNIEKMRFFTKELRHKIEWHEFTDLSVYPLKLASLELDLGICPLEDHSFNISKSALKWSEYSAMKVPSVVSNLDPYDCVADRVDGLKAKDEVAFADRICELMDSEQLRNKIATNAYERNLKDFNIETVSDRWAEVFERAHLLPHKVTYGGEPIKPLEDKTVTLSNMPLNVKRELSMNGAR